MPSPGLHEISSLRNESLTSIPAELHKKKVFLTVMAVGRSARDWLKTSCWPKTLFRKVEHLVHFCVVLLATNRKHSVALANDQHSAS